MARLTTRIETVRFGQTFSTSGGSVDSLVLLVVEVERHGRRGRGEGVPTGARLLAEGEQLVVAGEAKALLDALDPVALNEVRGPADIQGLLPAGPARNALDCALWDLSARLCGRSVAQLAGLAMPRRMATAFTLSFADPPAMARDAAAHGGYPLLKIKLGSPGALERVAAVRAAAPDCAIIVDANGAWTLDDLAMLAPELGRLGVGLIEQPLPPGMDGMLAGFASPVPLCADESCHTRRDLDRVAGRYGYINIKLDKTGGLTEALALARAARASGLGIMVGCMAGTSLSMAPAAIIGAMADFVDLDGPLLLGSDRDHGFAYRDGWFRPVEPALWGTPQ